MANDYPVIKIGEIASSISETHKLGKEQLIFLNTSDILHGKFLHRTYSAVNEWPGQAKKSIRKDDILFSEIRPSNGRWAYVEHEADDFVVSTKLMVIRAKQDKLFPKFLYQFLTSIEITRWLQHLAESRSGTFPQITFDQVSNLELPLPPLAEQKAIASVLGALDDKIELNRRMNATLEAMARALFQSWFVDFDPVHAKQSGQGFNSPRRKEEAKGFESSDLHLFPDSFQDSELGPIPKGWQVNRVREVVEEVFDGPHATPPDAEEGPVFLGIKNLTGSGLDLSEIRHIAESDWPRWTKRVTPRQFDIVFSYEATLGFFALIPPVLRCCLGRRLALIRPKPQDGHPHFWFHQFIGPDFQRYLMQHSVQGATVDRIPLIHFPNYLVLNPPSALKEAFENRVAPLWARIHTNSEQSHTLATLRDTLLPKLLSGELKVAETRTT